MGDLPIEGRMPGADDPLAFAQLLLNLLDEGRRTATYKLAVLLALVDCAVEGTDASGRPRSVIPTRDLAQRVIELYWPQVRDYPQSQSEQPVLRQSSQPRAITVDAVRELRLCAWQEDITTLYLTKERLGASYERTLDKVELNLVRMPLGKLQRPAGFNEETNADYPRFLYDDVEFRESVTLRHLRRKRPAVVLKPNVADWLVSLAGLLRPLLEVYWTREVARFNRWHLNEDDLRSFLFGSTREDLGKVRRELYEFQAGRCFYCCNPVPRCGGEVDHFVPWSRLPNDSLTNLVLADSRCNNAKRDYYADLDLVKRWAARPQQPFEDVAARVGRPLGRSESLRITRGLYAHLPDGTALWQGPGIYSLLHRSELLEVLPLLSG